MSQHISPRTTIFCIWHHITSHHHISKHKIFHITQPQSKSVSHHSTSTTSPHVTHIQHRSTFHTTLYSTTHYTTTSWFYITPPHISHCIVFHIWHQSHNGHTAYCIIFYDILRHNSTSPHFTSHRNFPHPALRNIPHHAVFHTTLILRHFNRTMSGNISSTSVAPHFTSTIIRIIPPHLCTPFHITPTFHLASRHAHHIQIQHITPSHSTLHSMPQR